MSSEILDEPESPESLPVLYSPQVILWFSVLFSPIFGCIMMAMNLKDTTLKFQCIVFGVVYTVLCVGIAEFLNLPSFLPIVSSIAGGYLLQYLFWFKYIGRETPFVPRPWNVPLFIGVFITLAYVAVIVLHL